MRRRARKGPNPKYWWVWAIAIILLILLAQNTVGRLAGENAQEREGQQTEANAPSQNEDNQLDIPEDSAQ